MGELGSVQPLRWHMPGDERGDCQGGRENNSGRRVKMKTVSGVPFPESVFSIVGGSLIRVLFKLLPRRFALVMPSDERKEQDSRRKGIKKEDRPRQGKDIEHIIHIYI